ncbi:MAG: MBL fold metallo-hydrolase [Candidatus Hydrothermarchaeales archaeon]
MEIVPLAADSMGTRSMATYVETSDSKILIDPGVALGPYRYRLPPHPYEIERMNEHWAKIKDYANKADILIVTHYHYDHHDPQEPEIYRNKEVFLKHPNENINRSQKKRASYFIKQLKDKPKKLKYSDGRTFSYGDTTIRFSKPVFHGTNDRLGYVTEVSIREGDLCFLHTSDVEGPSIDDQAEFIFNEKPNVLFLDGPLSYMLGYRYSYASLESSIKNMVRIIKETPIENLVLDHHFLRDLKWEERISKVFEMTKAKDVEILTSAEFWGMKNDMFEARRRELYEEFPV